MAWLNYTRRLKPKDLLPVPWMIAMALQADGWYLRSDIIWAKPNPMPESVTDRPTSAHEHVFLLAKSRSYFYDADAIREPQDTLGERHEGRSGYRDGHPSKNGGYAELTRSLHPAGRNRRNVWEIATQPYPEAHFATFPTKLVEPCVLAGSSPRACGECGAPWRRVVDAKSVNPWSERKIAGAARGSLTRGYNENHGDGMSHTLGVLRETRGWRPSCPHDDNTGRSVILDPFTGSGTAGLVALRHSRSFIGIELSPAYCEMARNRIRGDQPLFNSQSEAVA